MYSWKYAFENFEGIIRGHPDVTLHTDHLNLVTGLWAHCSPKIERWRLYLEQWKPFKIVHIRGTAAEQAVADGLSRLHARNLNDMATAEISDEESRLAAELGEGGADERLFDHSCSMKAAWTSLSSRAPVVAASSTSRLEVERWCVRRKALRLQVETAESGKSVISLHGIEIDRVNHTAKLNATELDLTPTEFRMLWTMMSQPGRPFSRNELMETSRGEDANSLERTIDVHVRSLRKKLEPQSDLIETVRGVGYRFIRK